MRPQKGKAPVDGSRSRAEGAEHNKQTNGDRLATGECRCGGPGGYPGMWPVCPTCSGTDQIMREVFLRRTVGYLGLTGLSS